jgi:hypothetical protein
LRAWSGHGQARNCRTSLQHAKLVEIAGVGHLPQIEAFDQYSQALLGL